MRRDCDAAMDIATRRHTRGDNLTGTRRPPQKKPPDTTLCRPAAKSCMKRCEGRTSCAEIQAVDIPDRACDGSTSASTVSTCPQAGHWYVTSSGIAPIRGTRADRHRPLTKASASLGKFVKFGSLRHAVKAVVADETGNYVESVAARSPQAIIRRTSCLCCYCRVPTCRPAAGFGAFARTLRGAGADYQLFTA